MKSIIHHSDRIIRYITFPIALLFLAFVLNACFEEELPGVGSIEDLTPPASNFDFTPSEGDYKTINFSNTSVSATDFEWNFGDGSSSTDREPSHTYSADGEYTVTLKASDKLGVESTYSASVNVVEPVVAFTPEILNPGFDIEGDDSFRDNWRNGDLGGVIQITSSPIHDGVKASKYPSAGDRIAYQLITVQPETDYTVSFYYTMKTSPVGTLKVSILAGEVNDPSLLEPATIAFVEVNDQSDASTYVQASVSFNSGVNDQVAIFVSNEGVECRVDTFTITED